MASFRNAIKKIIGLSGSDLLVGSALDDDIYGLAGNDKLKGAGGNDNLYGGTGTDTAVFVGRFSDYNFQNLIGGLQVTHARGTQADGSDYVDNDVEYLEFADITIDLTRNSAPIAINDINGSDRVKESGGIANGTAGDATAAGNVLANDTDIEVTLGRQTLSAIAKTVSGIFGTLTLNADGSWTYRLNDNDADTQRLAQGTCGVDTFSYIVRDSAGATATGTLNITIDGSNDAPVITSSLSNASGTVIESGHTDAGAVVPGTATVSGTLTSSDVDAGATATWSIAGASVYGGIAINAATGQWTYTLNNGLTSTQRLNEGQTVTETFTATVKDNFGAIATQLVTVTIKGTNDKPVVTSGGAAASGTVIESGHTDAGAVVAGTATVSGTLTSSDVDAGATATWSIAGASAYGGIAINAATGQWTYTLNNGLTSTQRLNEGQTVTETFTATVKDNFGAIATQLVTVTIKGTNDKPVITSTAYVSAIEETQSALTACGRVVFSDADGGDAPAAAFSSFAATPAGVVLTPAQALAFQNAFSITNSATGTWAFNLPAADCQFLGAGEGVTLVYTVTVTDGSGATSSQNVTIKIDGTNDTPIVSASTDGAVIEDETSPALTDSGTIAFDDVDLTDAHMAGAVAHGSNTLGGTLTASVTAPAAGAATGLVTWNYSVANSATQYLAKDQTATELFTVTIDDGNGGQVTQDVTVTITGTNDAPVFGSTNSESSGSAFQVNSQALGEQDIAYISTLPDDRFLITWTDRYEGVRKGQILDDAGNKVGGEFSIMPATTGYGSEQIELVDGRIVVLAVSGSEFGKIIGTDGAVEPGAVEHFGNQSDYLYTTALTGGGFAIVMSVNGFVDIGAQAYDAQGNKVGPQWVTPSGTFNEYVVKDIVSLENGGYIVLFDRVGGGLKAQRFDGAGNAVGGEYDVGSLVTDVPLFGDIDSARLPDGRILVAWAQDSGSGNKDVFAKFLDAEGVPIGSAFGVNSGTSGTDAYPKITLTAAGTIAITWYGDGAHRVQFFDTSGSPVGSEKVISSAVPTNHFAIANVIYATPTLDGGIFYSWRGFDGSGEGAMARYLKGDGTFSGPEFSVGPTTDSDQFGGESAVNSQGVLIAISTDYSGSDGSAVGVFAKKFQLTEQGELVTEDTVSKSGTITFTDVDLADVHTVTSAYAASNTAASLGTFAATLAHDTTGTGLGGEIDWTYTLNNAAAQYLAAGESKTETFTISVFDGTATVTKNIVIKITGVNDEVVITSGVQAGTVIEDDAGNNVTTGAIAFSDVDLSDGHAASFTSSNATALGTFALQPVSEAANAATGSVGWSYTLNDAAAQYLGADERITESFAVAITDSKGSTKTETVTITITGSNDAPVVTAAALGAFDEDDASPATIDLLQYASDPDRTDDIDTGSVTYSVTDGTWAPAVAYSVDADTGVLTFDPNQFNALGVSESVELKFSYDVIDRKGGVTPATAVVTITGSNDAPVVSGAVTQTVDEDDANPAAVNLLSNASDPDRTDDIDTGSVTYSVTDGTWVAPVTYSVNAETGVLTFDPNQFNALSASDSIELTFSYDVIDGNGGVTPATAVVTITGSNYAPVAVADIGTAGENETRSFDVLTNDIDADAGDSKTLLPLGAVTVSSANASVHGINAAAAFAISGGQITFTPDVLFDALDYNDTATVAVAYTMQDGEGVTSSSTLTLTVTGANDNPIANNDAIGGLLYTYVGHYAVYDGPSWFTNPETYSGVEAAALIFGGTPSDYAISTTFSNDPSEITHTAWYDGWGEGPMQFADDYELDLGAPGYNDPSGSGTARSAYVRDHLSNTGMYRNHVWRESNTAPITHEDASVTIAAASLLGNDTDVDNGDVLTITAVSATSANGATVTLSGTNIIYNPAAASATAIQALDDGKTLPDSFTYTISDGHGGTSTATVTFNVAGRNDAPAVIALNRTISEDGPLSQDLLSGATDVDGDTLSIVNLPGSITTTGGRILAGGDFTLTGSTFALTAQGLADFNDLAGGATDTFNFNFGVSDGTVTTNNTLAVTVTGVNDAPVFSDSNGGYTFGPISENQAAGVQVGTVSASDVDGDTRYYEFLNGTQTSGLFNINRSTGAITTNAALDYEATSTHYYDLNVVVRDRSGGGSTDTASVRVSIGDVLELHPGAVLIGPSSFSTAPNANVGNSNIPWVTVSGSGGASDLFAFNLRAGMTITADIDGANFDSVVTVFNATGQRLVANDDNSISLGGAGSTSNLDSYLSYTATSTELHYVGVSVYSNFPATVDGVGAGGSYALQISIDNILA